ncbi:2-hydroxy-3-oxopropionate reductase [Rhodovulum sp. P5]|uniref:L-threonate dehydrogenase n=1 Tax=Rhodovulum sp. P5 TaxID=1564506 RepID=UPI0009C2317E|nr:L-threonate dehydrogenase [Rhodovulum sp. P5]ARE42217.1 2-hydroxy-3-oxopropionate reductase [Rhodovulum sp. P5]
MTDQRSVAVVGLGSMGYGVAGSILRAGHRTYGIDINPDQVARFRAEGGTPGRFPDIGKDVDVVVIVVINSAQTEDVLFGAAGIVPSLRDGAVVMSCATVAPDFARRMEARCAEHGLLYLDAPISGGPKRAADGALSVLASGSAAAFDAARPVLDAMAANVFELGEAAGAGSAMKAVNQLLVGVHIAATAEAMTFGMTQGIDPDKFIEIITKSAGTSWALEDRAPHIAHGDYTPHSAVNIWPKDLGIVQDIARSASFSAPISSAALQQFIAAAGMGLGREDDAALAKVYAHHAGLTLPGGE